MTTPFPAGGFTWTLGIEDTCVHPGDTTPILDEFELTEHDRRWPEDLQLAAGLGAAALRYGVSWPQVHLAPGRYDWARLDPVLARCGELGLAVIADLVHYGTPSWLEHSFLDPRYPEMIAEFAAALCVRYPGVVTAITPLNEPLTTASFCGLRGIWPPRLEGWDGWTRITLAVAEGIVASVAAVRAAAPAVSVVHVEAATLTRAATTEAQEHAHFLAGIGWLPTDLVLGRVDQHHRFSDWLLRHGADPGLLEKLRRAPASVDVLGVNYYPDLTPRLISLVDGQPRQQSFNAGAAGLETVLRGFAERYRLPLAITETSIEADDAGRRDWLQESVAATGRLRGDGLDVRGYTWWPLFDFVDWSWAAGGANVEEFEVDVVRDPARGKADFLRRMGLIRLDDTADGLARTPTPAAEAFRLASRSGR
jgi:Beta-glucosidase/6-phospho-beta-glucosidase/beta-galactosidase